ncbi:MAG: serine/threonine protein kinase [Myxococcales bacterium]|nr:serine/threonine protein kinase [Myxococcales bacterium]
MRSATEGGVDHTGPRPTDVGLPAVFGRYLLIQRLSRGGMGEIFLAKHGLAGFEKLCVIKKVLPSLAEDAQFISRFIDEAQVAIKLHHVNVAQVFEVGRVGDEYFLALEYLEGRDLRRLLTVVARQGRRIPPPIALFIAREMANGLAYAHRRTSSDGTSLGLVHCDISPPNVLVSFEGETKIIDFGIAKSALRATATDPKMGFGKFGYMAPEQLVRGGVVDHRTDLYAVGAVLFELLTAERLYEVGDNPDYRTLARQVVKGEHRLPSQLDPALGRFDALVQKALRPRPEDRFQTAAELRDAVQEALVAIAPTISTDALGSFLREVFAGEMASQRELLDRAAAAHLEDFRQELTTQSIETISFALANMPLYQPATAAVPRVPALPASPGKAMARASSSGAFDAGPSSIVIDDAAIYARERADAASRRRRTIIAATAAGLAGVGLTLAWVLTRGGGERPPPAIAQPVVTPLDAGLPPVDAAPPIDAAPAVVPPPPPVRPPHGGTGSGSAVRPPGGGTGSAKDPPPPSAPDESALRSKFQAVTREYRAYKAEFGPRLESEWTDVASMVGLLSSPEKRAAFDKKIDRLRAMMKSNR